MCNLTYFSNYIFFKLNQYKAYKFFNNLNDTKKIQIEYLLSLVKKNRNTIYGSKYNFRSIYCIDDFQKNVPITEYEDYKLYLKDIMDGKQNILTKERIKLLEPSSGTTTDTKLIPYTPRLQKEFQNGIAPWLFDLYKNRTELLKGKSYWSISPNIKNFDFYSQVPIGFEEDSEYFGTLKRRILNKILIIPSVLSQVEDMDYFRYITLLFLLQEKGVTFFSFWNPTFLNLLFENIFKWKSDLIRDLYTPSLDFCKFLDKTIKRKIIKFLICNPKRALEVEKIFLSSFKNEADYYKSLWPNLILISCWGDGNSRHYIKNIKALFPDVEIQEKGLLATEGIVSIPLFQQKGKILAYRSHFFEFEDKNDCSIKTIDELKVGNDYSVILTTGGGLYRYRLNDIIRVTGYFHSCPLIEFLGKEDKISDLFGEKLNENFIQRVLEGVFRQFKLETEFYMLAPEREEGNLYFYALFIEIKKKDNFFYSQLKQIQKNIDIGIRKNFHYDYCRRLEQLKALKIFLIENSSYQDYLKGCRKMKQKIGNVKPVTLHNKIGWKNIFHGHFINDIKQN